jgi:hypothetical protein
MEPNFVSSHVLLVYVILSVPKILEYRLDFWRKFYSHCEAFLFRAHSIMHSFMHLKTPLLGHNRRRRIFVKQIRNKKRHGMKWCSLNFRYCVEKSKVELSKIKTIISYYSR